jgi:DNA-binding response OmpR family regulator
MFCVQIVDFGGIMLDYEGLVLVYGAKRYFLRAREFTLAEALLCAEGEDVSVERLVALCNIDSASYERDVVNHASLRLRREIFIDPRLGLLTCSRNAWRLIRPDGSQPAAGRQAAPTPRSSLKVEPG